MGQHGAGRDDLAAEATFLLSLSQSTSESFGTRLKRTPNWFMIAFALQYGPDGQIDSKNLDFFRDEISTLKTGQPGGPRSAWPHPWMIKCVNDLSNADGPLLEPIRSAKKQQLTEPNVRNRSGNLIGYKFTQNFDECAKKYVLFFWKINRERLGLKRLPKLDLRMTYSYLSALFEIQRLHYVPPWRALIGELNETASRQFNAKIFKSKKFEILHWMLTLMFVRSWIENAKEKLTDKTVADQIHPKYVMASLEEVVAALHELSDRKGSRILNAEQNARGIPIYFFNAEAYLIPLENYLRTTMKCRSLWQEKLATLS